MVSDSDSHYMRICEHLQRVCAPRGFDLLQPLQVGWYNRAVAASYRVPEPGGPASLAVVIGNTRALWEPFRQAVATDPALADALHPLQRYTTRVILAAVAGLGLACDVRFDFTPPPRRVAMQDLAHIAGLAYKSPSYLSVHPTYGPWIALRALLVFPVSGPPGPAPALKAPCDCERHCAAKLARAIELSQRDRQAISTDDVAATWRAFVAVRDACPIGREYRYSEPQIGYHYAKERAWLQMPERDTPGCD